ncbi:MAG: class I SAM-dependent methyltransferase [Nitrospira sp.]|nr:class I SAM-dependent methyltransferase [Nitrospira sp.]
MGITLVSRPHCPLCGNSGEMLYCALRDRLYDVPGQWNLRHCADTDCGLVWLDPAPVPADTWKTYRNYYTHGVEMNRPGGIDGVIKRTYHAVLRATGLGQARDRVYHMYLRGFKPGRLLEIGCGSGERLAKFRAMGWEVIGQEVDPAAAQHARERHGLEVRVGDLDTLKLAPCSFDAVVINHVIEHVHDPVHLLNGCHGLLREGGILVAVTPNVRSYGHKHFREFWLGLDPPRHLHLFTPEALLATAARAGFAESRCWTTAVNAEIVAVGSYDIQAAGHHRLGGSSRLAVRWRALWFQLWALLAMFRDRYRGEECVLWSVRKTVDAGSGDARKSRSADVTTCG